MTSKSLRVTRDLEPDLWREFLHDNPQAGIFHTPEMFTVFARTSGYKPGLWAVLDAGGCPVALFTPVRIALMSGPMGLLTSRAVAYGGVACRCGREEQAALNLLLEAYDRERSGSVLFTELRNAAPAGCLQSTLDANGYRHEDHLNFYIDLTQPETALWGNIRSNARRNVRKAETMGVTVDEITKPDGLGSVYDVLRAVYKRLQVPLPDASLFISAFQTLYPLDMMRVLVARMDNVSIGVLTLLIHQGVMTYWYTGTLREFSTFRPADLLVWRALKLGADSGCRMFDFGGGGRPDEEYGVRDFKAKFGGKLVNYGRNTCVHAPRRLSFSRRGYQLVRQFL
ncbi:MAG: hypothetical protein DCC51_03445 [Anaerolineae bacterium]|nr:MAG: hypothetical protein DCC51_03445 [Anaerolineae bacterium]